MIAPFTAEQSLEVAASYCLPTLIFSSRDESYGTQ